MSKCKTGMTSKARSCSFPNLIHLILDLIPSKRKRRSDVELDENIRKTFHPKQHTYLKIHQRFILSDIIPQTILDVIRASNSNKKRSAE